MTLQLKTITAFALSFAVTLMLAVVNYHESRLIESSLNRLQLSSDQLRKLDQLQGVFDSHQQAISNFLLTENEAHLATADDRMEDAVRMIDALIEVNGVELQCPIKNHLDAREAQEEQSHVELLLKLRGRLAEAKGVVAPIVALEQRGMQEEAENLMFDEYNSGYLHDLKSSVEQLHAGEDAHFIARKAQHDYAVASLRSSAKWYGIVGGAVAVLAVLFLKESLDEMAEAKRRETDANIAKSTFLANMSHEIRTPLNGILGFARLLMRDPVIAKSSKSAEYVATILNSGRHLLNLINDVLDLSKVEAGQFSCERVACEVVPLMEEVVSLVRVRANSKGLPLELSWAGPVPEVIQTDPVRFKQILVNLIGNAVKFTDRGRVTVVAWLDRSLGRSDIVVEVADTGIGIAGKDKAAIFKPFFQADNSLTRQFEGTGLGLAISARLAEMLGGSITVDSTPGEGSTFTLRIDAGPLDDVKMLSELVRNDHSPKLVTNEPRVASLRGRVLLVVDDGATNRELVRVVAQEAGAKVLEAGNGREGVEAAMSEEVDAVLMDIQMPVMDGLTAATVLRGRGFTKPIIALTAHAMSGDRARCFESGCSGYLAKPIDPDDLLAELAKHINADGEQTTIPTQAAEHPLDAEEQPITCSLPTEKPAFLNIAKRFVNDLLARVETMQYEYESNDWKSLGDSAHWLKGSGGTAGFHCFTEPAAALHRATVEADLPAIEARFHEIRALVERLPEEFCERKRSVVQ